MINNLKGKWDRFALKHPTLAEFIIFFVVSNGVTVLQLFLMPLFKWLFGMTDLLSVSFQVGHIGSNFDGTPYYIFNYAAGALESGGGGGLAYFLAVQLTMAVAQVINFFIQRKVTFKYTGNVVWAAFWYVIAYLIITIGAAVAQGFYKAPIYRFFIETCRLGGFGETLADIVTMLINCVISFWVFFPILKIIFHEKSSTVMMRQKKLKK